MVFGLRDPPRGGPPEATCHVLVVLREISLPEEKESALISTLEEEVGLQAVRAFSLKAIGRRVVLFSLTRGQSMETALSQLAAHPSVEFAQPNQPYWTAGVSKDPLVGLQYGPRHIGALEVHEWSIGKAVTVAVIDSGIDPRHVDLPTDRLERVDLFGDGPPRGETHGTLIAGIIAAVPNNGAGIVGIAPGVKLLGLRACRPLARGSVEARCTTETITRAMDLAMERRAHVINLSLGGPEDRLVRMLAEKAVSRGVAVVAAAGNGGPTAPPSYPAALKPVIAVTAVDLANEHYPASNVGSYIDLAAPGVDVVSALPSDEFNFFSGTSMAAAHVSGTIALLLQIRPELNVKRITALLVKQAEDLGPSGPDRQYGAGLLNACRTLEVASEVSLCR